MPCSRGGFVKVLHSCLDGIYCRKTVDAIRNCQGRLYEGHGQLLVETKAITLAAPVSLKFDTLMEIDGVALKLGYSKKKLGVSRKGWWERLKRGGILADFSDELRKSVIHKAAARRGGCRNIRVKLVHNFKPAAFVAIVDPTVRRAGYSACQSSDTSKAG